jgi:hypothetical protein
MHEHHFKIAMPLTAVVDALRSMSTVTVLESSDLHCIAELAGGAGIIARTAYPDAAEIIVAESGDDFVARRFADELAEQLECEVSSPRPFEVA